MKVFLFLVILGLVNCSWSSPSTRKSSSSKPKAGKTENFPIDDILKDYRTITRKRRNAESDEDVDMNDMMSPADKTKAPLKASTKPVPLKASTKPIPGKASTKPAPVKTSTKPAPVKATTKPAPVKASTKPAPVKTSTKPAPVKTSTKPAPVKASTKPAPVKASTKPTPGKTSTKPIPGKASTKPAPVKASTKPTPGKTSTKPAPVEASTKPSPVKASTKPSPVKASTQPVYSYTKTTWDVYTKQAESKSYYNWRFPGHRYRFKIRTPWTRHWYRYKTSTPWRSHERYEDFKGYYNHDRIRNDSDEQDSNALPVIILSCLLVVFAFVILFLNKKKLIGIVTGRRNNDTMNSRSLAMNVDEARPLMRKYTA